MDLKVGGKKNEKNDQVLVGGSRAGADATNSNGRAAKITRATWTSISNGAPLLTALPTLTTQGRIPSYDNGS